MSTTFSSRSESNDLPLPLPLRKLHGGGASTEQYNFNSALHNANHAGGRYAVPESNAPLNSSSPQNSHRSLGQSSEKLSNKNANLSMEQALSQVASLSLRDLAVKLELPVDRLSSYTIQQLAQKLTEMDLVDGGNNLNKKKTGKSDLSTMSDKFNQSEFNSGFDDDFSTASAPLPPRTTVTNLLKDSNSSHSGSYDRYAVFRELAVELAEDASGFSIENNVGSYRPSDDDEEQSTITLRGEKQFTSRGSSSERTLQADDPDPDVDLDITEQLKSGSFAAGMANTMDDVTDVNFSDDEGKFGLDNDDDDFGSGFVKNEWATFESNFDDGEFATTALVKAEDGNESPWDSEEDQNQNQDIPKVKREPSPAQPPPPVPDHFDFKPFEKPPALQQQSQPGGESPTVNKPRKYSDTGSGEVRLKSTSSPERIRSPPGHFQRQNSGSSRHSERSSGNNPSQPGPGGKISDYSDSGPPEHRERTRRPHRRGSQDYDRWDFERSDRDGSGRYRDRADRDRDYIRPDSRSSYTSISWSKYNRNGDSEEEYNLNNAGSSMRRIKGGAPSGVSSNTYRRRSKDYDRDVVELVVDNDDDEEDRSYASHHSGNHSYNRRHHRRVPSSKYYPHHSRSSGGRRDRGGSPDGYSNHESDESLEDEVYARKRDRENYAREREYYERHHRPRPNSGNSSTGKRYSPRHPDPYYSRRRGGGSGRYNKESEDRDGDSRELSEYSGEDEHPSSSGRGVHGHHHGSHRRVRAKRSSYYRDRDGREREPPPRSHYYTNSPSWDSESNPEGENVKEHDTNKKAGSSRRPNSGSSRNTTGGEDQPVPPSPRERQRGSPEHYGSSRRRENKESASRRYQSELALNSKDSPNKLSTFDNFEDDFGASSLPDASNSKSRNASLSSPPVVLEEGDLMIVESSISEKDNHLAKKAPSPFGDDFAVNPQGQNGDQIEKLLIIDEPTEDQDKAENKNGDSQQSEILAKEEDGIIATNENGVDSTNSDTFPPPEESKVFSYSGRRLESIKSEEEKSNDDNSHSQNSEGLVQMKKSDSFNIFKQRADDPFADDEFFT